MPWTYSQSTGVLTDPNNEIVTKKGYAGNGTSYNNPDDEHLRDRGPIPRGQYAIGAAFFHKKFRDKTMRLTPVGHRALGRTDFLIHSNNIKNPRGASKGCIVLDLIYRKQIAESDDTVLNVVR